MRLATLALLLLTTAPVAARAPEISIDIQPTPAVVGLLMTVTVTITGAEGADCRLLGVPAVEGARLSFTGGPSSFSYTENRNGRRRQSVQTRWLFELVPEHEGLLELPAFRFDCRGSEVRSSTTVVPVEAGRSYDVVDIEVQADAREIWVGQVVTFLGGRAFFQGQPWPRKRRNALIPA